MDLIDALTLLAPEWLGWIMRLVGASAVLAMFLPVPVRQVGAYAKLYGTVNALAANIGHARNAAPVIRDVAGQSGNGFVPVDVLRAAANMRRTE